MDCKRRLGSVLLTVALAAAPLATGKADSAIIAFPPFWPLMTLAAIFDSGTSLIPPYYYGLPPCHCLPPPQVYYYPSPGYGAPGPYQPGYYPAR